MVSSVRYNNREKEDSILDYKKDSNSKSDEEYEKLDLEKIKKNRSELNLFTIDLKMNYNNLKDILINEESDLNSIENKIYNISINENKNNNLKNNKKIKNKKKLK